MCQSDWTLKQLESSQHPIFKHAFLFAEKTKRLYVHEANFFYPDTNDKSVTISDIQMFRQVATDGFGV